MKNHLLTFVLFTLFTLGFSFNLSAQCPANQNEVAIIFQGDENLPLDNSRWEIRNEQGLLIDAGNADAVLCLPSSLCFTFTVFDDFGDGLAGETPGYYSFSYAGEQIAANVNFGYEQTVIFGGCTPGSSCFTPLQAAISTDYTVDGGEAWYVFVPETSGYYELTTCGFSNACNTAIWVYDRCLGLSSAESQEEAILYNDDYCEDTQAAVFGVLQAGTTYYLRLGDENNDCENQAFQWRLNFNGEVSGCTDPLSCNYDPLATVNDGSCLYGPNPNCPSGPDLVVNPGTLANSIYASNVGDSECYVNEGCLQGYGQRQVVRFTTHIKNVGNEDYVIGSPDPNTGQFEFDECHGHWHYEGYAEYRLYDQNGLALPVGFKNGFCVLDLECSGGGTPGYGCSYMGIAAGCGDIYGSGLACQWIDVTDLPEGFYTMVIVVNWDRTPDLFGREEVTYENNWDQVCFQLVRDENGSHNINFVGNCPIFTDCEGLTQGEAQPDCFGICGGDGKYGDLNVNTIYDTGDISMYLNGILDNTIPVTNCTDLTSNELVDIEDAAWLMDCILVENQTDGHVSHSHSCQLPTIGISNPYQTATFSLLEHNVAEQSVVIGLQNPNVELIATHLRMGGMELTNAELLLNGYDAQLLFRPDGQLITFSHAYDTAPRNANAVPFIKVYYSTFTGGGTCIGAITTINKNIERVVSNVGDDNCLSDIEPCSETSPLDSDEDGVCDDMDICPGGNDNIDSDEDGVPDDCDVCEGFDDAIDTDGDQVPDQCDICPGIPDIDDDNDGVCNTEDICPGGDDNLDTDEDGVPDACDVCPNAADDDSDNDGVCDDIDICIGVNDSLFCEEYRLQLTFDDYPQESSWAVLNAAGDTVISHGLYPVNVEFMVIDEFFCLPSGEYTFVMYDTFGDGMCCAYGVGGYELSKVVTGEIVGSGSNFNAVSFSSFIANTMDVADTDGDGVCNPLDQCPGQDDMLDTDGDGIPNGCDECPTGDFVDSDNDTVCDDADVCPGGNDLADADNDGTPDSCDSCPNSATGDSDNDGVCDDLDLCPGFSDQNDADNDGTPDACDSCPNSATGDSDGDSICDDLDQCPGFDDLADADADGTPDACDDCPNSATGDSDNDGICDDLDICPGGDDNVDTDQDGQPDTCDICPTLSDNPDVDEDGVCDDIDICVGVDDNAACADIELTITFDEYAPETSWQLLDQNGEIAWSNSESFSNSDDLTTQTFTICLTTGFYSFTIFDAASDGLCCGYGKGSYILAYPNIAEPIANGGEFGSFETTGFDVQDVGIPDEDQDGVCDPMDTCPGFDDTLDSDNDGMADGCDDCPNSATGDSDGDTVCDDLDLCPGFDDMIDIDEDGIPDGCDDVINSIEELNANAIIQALFPNPTMADLQIRFHAPVAGTLRILDLLGRQHGTYIVDQEQNKQLNVVSLPAGTYLLVFTHKDGSRAVRRFVKIN